MMLGKVVGAPMPEIPPPMTAMVLGAGVRLSNGIEFSELV
jgi:hypothetical protein